MRSVVGALGLVVGAIACSHDWDIVPPGAADGGGTTTTDGGGTTSGASGSSTSSGSTTSSSGTGSTSGPPPPSALKCPTDCKCGGGTCSFECTDNCTIDCPKGSTCNIVANGHTCTAVASNLSADCSAGSVTCKVTPNGKDMQCR